ncbi:MAG: type II TA system antitoxin MqsA family protein [Bacillota bacterium]
MKKIKSINEFCIMCMKEHEIDIVEKKEENVFKGEKVKFRVTYKYCSNTDQYSESEKMMNENSLRMKDAYRSKVGLLTSKEIKNIRKKYGISQLDLAKIIGIGEKTITRYENHQVQDKAYDRLLKKISKDPSWFLELVKDSKDELSDKSYKKLVKNGNREYRNKQNEYLIETIEAMYAEFHQEDRGNSELNLDKVVEMVNYLASKISNLYKVKLMKLLWYSDSISYKLKNRSISGLVYKALPMGAVPESYQEILELEGIRYDVHLINGNESYHFLPDNDYQIKNLSDDEIKILDEVIHKYGVLDTQVLIDKMHDEVAYRCTDDFCIIDYSHSQAIEI